MTLMRLFVTAPLSASAVVRLEGSQAHHVTTVMRRGAGDAVRLFNGTDGEWQARIVASPRGNVTLQVEAQVRPQEAEPDLWLVFALLKRNATDLVVQKATELGVSALIPVLTERTNPARVNEDRLRLIATEAAEQSERLTVPNVHSPRPLERVLASWPDRRPLFAALERGDAPTPPAANQPAALLIGPEGGFGPIDRNLLSCHGFVRPVSLGPRILRAETAAIAGLTLLQRPA